MPTSQEVEKLRELYWGYVDNIDFLENRLRSAYIGQTERSRLSGELDRARVEYAQLRDELGKHTNSAGEPWLLEQIDKNRPRRVAVSPGITATKSPVKLGELKENIRMPSYLSRSRTDYSYGTNGDYRNSVGISLPPIAKQPNMAARTSVMPSTTGMDVEVTEYVNAFIQDLESAPGNSGPERLFGWAMNYGIVHGLQAASMVMLNAVARGFQIFTLGRGGGDEVLDVPSSLDRVDLSLGDRIGKSEVT